MTYSLDKPIKRCINYNKFRGIAPPTASQENQFREKEEGIPHQHLIKSLTIAGRCQEFQIQ